MSLVDSDLFRTTELHAEVDSEECSDIEFVCADGRVRASRYKLRRQPFSDFFRRLVDQGFSEGKSRELVLADVSRSALTVILKFLYSGTLPADLHEADAFEVLEVSDQFLVPDLKIGVLHWMKENMSPTIAAALMYEDARRAGVVKEGKAAEQKKEPAREPPSAVDDVSFDANHTAQAHDTNLGQPVASLRIAWELDQLYTKAPHSIVNEKEVIETYASEQGLSNSAFRAAGLHSIADIAAASPKALRAAGVSQVYDQHAIVVFFKALLLEMKANRADTRARVAVETNSGAEADSDGCVGLSELFSEAEKAYDPIEKVIAFARTHVRQNAEVHLAFLEDRSKPVDPAVLAEVLASSKRNAGLAERILQVALRFLAERPSLTQEYRDLILRRVSISHVPLEALALACHQSEAMRCAFVRRELNKMIIFNRAWRESVVEYAFIATNLNQGAGALLAANQQLRALAPYTRALEAENARLRRQIGTIRKTVDHAFGELLSDSSFSDHETATVLAREALRQRL